MSKLTLDEAIKYCLEVAEQNETQADKIGRQFIGSAMDKHATDFRECAAESRQLAEWLKELKNLREENKVLTSECNRLIKEKGELNELKEKAVSDIWRREARLREAKRLLKAAVEDFSYCSGIYGPCYYNIGCGVCVDCNNTPCNEFQWRYADEALALIGEDGDAK